MFNNAKIEKSADLHHSYCRKCFSEYVKTRRHALGENLPLCENASCSSFLGVYISEAVLSTVFNSVVRAPYGNIGYDFVCGKGLKIDVKSSCFHKKINAWSFCTKKNKIADYFICLAFDSRINFIPVHIWIIPGSVVNHLSGFHIKSSYLEKWMEYEKPLGNIPELVNKLTTNAVDVHWWQVPHARRRSALKIGDHRCGNSGHHRNGSQNQRLTNRDIRPYATGTDPVFWDIPQNARISASWAYTDCQAPMQPRDFWGREIGNLYIQSRYNIS